jgi:hypothetical protein
MRPSRKGSYRSIASKRWIDFSESLAYLNNSGATSGPLMSSRDSDVSKKPLISGQGFLLRPRTFRQKRGGSSSVLAESVLDCAPEAPSSGFTVVLYVRVHELSPAANRCCVPRSMTRTSGVFLARVFTPDEGLVAMMEGPMRASARGLCTVILFRLICHGISTWLSELYAPLGRGGVQEATFHFRDGSITQHSLRGTLYHANEIRRNTRTTQRAHIVDNIRQAQY